MVSFTVNNTIINNVVLDSDKRFFLKDGQILNSLEDLFQELQVMENHVFEHHVNSEKNDFANWIGDVFGDKFLAKNVQLAKDKDATLKLLFMNLFK